jgi:hypothetical protein
MRTRCLIAGIALIAAVADGAKGLEIVAGPYLQYPTETGIVIRWETGEAATAEAGHGVRGDKLQWQAGNGDTVYQEVRLEGLEKGGFYFYQVRSTGADGSVVQSEVYTFQTAVTQDSPFAFIVLCDTQANPKVLAQLASHAAAQRPQFTLLGGDLVSNGTVKEHWTGHFFPNMHALNSRVPLIPALGNHDKDAQYYYDYFSLPDPEYYYQFTYGNLELFIIDSQRPVTGSSEQYSWLEKALANSKATWKIVCFHRPPFSSDEDDYGDTTVQRPYGGDLLQRFPIEPLYEKYGVDIVWSGHIHSYERTHPLLGGKPVLEGGIVYMITGGGGGGLEKPGPWRSPETARVFSGHHYCLINVNGPVMRIEAFDLDNHLFDSLELRK